MRFVSRCLPLVARVLVPGLLLTSTPMAWAQHSFAPLAKWTAAVASGDTQAVHSFYSTNPPAVIVIGKEQSHDVDQEAAYWAGLKTEGISNVAPKVLSLESEQNETKLVMRVQAQKFGQSLVSSVVQVWVQQPDGWHIYATQRSPFVSDNGRRLPEPAKPNTALYASPQESVVELKQAMAKAGREHKRVLVMFGANWCYDCHVLDTTFHSKDFAPLLQQNYVVAHVSIGDEGKDNNDLAQRMGVSVEGVPVLVILDPDGKVVTAQQHHEFTSTTRIGPEDVRAFLEKYKPAH